MKNIFKLSLLTFSLWSFFSWADCPNGYFNFYCRGGGGMKLQNKVAYKKISLIGKFNRNPQAFSAGGPSGILPGKCTWHDRILYETEPAQFTFDIYDISNSYYEKATLDLLAQCASNRQCWFNTCVSNTGTNLILFSYEFTTTFDSVPVN